MNNTTSLTQQSTSWLSPIQLQHEYGLKISLQAKLRMDRKIPYSKINGKTIRYSRAKIDKWLEDSEVL
ncbi:hypothetical protein AS592_10450 [Sulfurovum riftiae]|uniref:Helix-turn-helix domain-containing protein n=1 Tax=Sulfurovum riftiae TaxID=1630136 RepID=A0A151CJ01_9BACT|nr:hypothetical protein AS592_10450 [Sulfurovum riftiae]